MSVDAGEIDRVARRYGGQCLVRGPLLFGPVVLIPAAAEDPLAGADLRHALTDRLDNLLVAGGAAEVEGLKARARARRSGRAHRASPGTIVAPPASMTFVDGPASGSTSALRADAGNAIAADRNRVGGRVALIAGVDAGVVDDEVGRLGIPGRAAAGEKSQTEEIQVKVQKFKVSSKQG